MIAAGGTTDLADVGQALLPWLLSIAIVGGIGVWSGRRHRKIHQRNRRDR